MNVFIDLGAFYGTFITKFKNSSMYKPDCQIHAFECNPHVGDIYYGKDVITHREAAWTFDGELDFFVSKDKPASVQGSSVFEEKVTGNLDTLNPRKIKCIDFSKWIKESFSESDNIIVKCNIEGAEYDVFRKCINDGTVSYFKKIWMRWHHHKCGIPQDIHDNLKRDIEISGVELHESYEDFN
jgi:FkbM family methyltransferase